MGSTAAGPAQDATGVGSPGGGSTGSRAASAGHRVVVVVSGGPAGPTPRVHPADAPLLLADELAAVRGDGCFETMLLTGGAAAEPRRHLARLARSARALDLVGPDERAWTEGIELAAREWGRTEEGMLRLVLARGPERGGPVTAYLTVAPVSSHAERARTEGVDVLTLQRGQSVDLAAAAPWQLIGAKTLSYATNMAALRYAEARGCQDVVYLSAEAEVLEGPRSTVLVARDGELVSPPPEIGILRGTTLEALTDEARARSVPVRSEHLLVTDLVAADAVWLLSSVTLAARVRRLDGSPLADGDPGIDVPGMIDAAIGRQA